MLFKPHFAERNRVYFDKKSGSLGIRNLVARNRCFPLFLGLTFCF